MSTVRCLVISDSHGRADRLSQAIKRAGNIDALFFLGDGLSDLANSISGIPPFTVLAVKGNCDFGNPLPDRNVYKVDSITLADHKIAFTHGDLFGAKYGLDGLIAFAKRKSKLFSAEWADNEHFNLVIGNGKVKQHCDVSFEGRKINALYYLHKINVGKAAKCIR